MPQNTSGGAHSSGGLWYIITIVGNLSRMNVRGQERRCFFGSPRQGHTLKPPNFGITYPANTTVILFLNKSSVA